MTELPKMVLISDKKVAECHTKYQVRHAQREADLIIYQQALDKIAELEKRYENRSPTEWAYEQACKTIEKVKAERDTAIKAVEAKWLDAISQELQTYTVSPENTVLDKFIAGVLNRASQYRKEKQMNNRLLTDDRIAELLEFAGDTTYEDEGLSVSTLDIRHVLEAQRHATLEEVKGIIQVKRNTICALGSLGENNIWDSALAMTALDELLKAIEGLE